MPTKKPKPKANRGPGAAAENRAALIRAAREIFDEGLEAPFSAVAKRAGVSQGVLYRHFPDRLGLALAVFEENLDDLEVFAARPGADLQALLDRVTRHTIASTAFIEMRGEDQKDPRLELAAGRMRKLFETRLKAAQELRVVRKSLTTDDLLLALFMLANVLAKTPVTERASMAKKVWALIPLGD